MGLFKKQQQQSSDDVVAPDDPEAMLKLESHVDSFIKCLDAVATYS